jgi:hypothetical protein
MIRKTVLITGLAFRDFRVFTIPKAQANRICVKICLLCDVENFNFFHLEILRTRENDVIVQSGVVGVSAAKGSETVGVYVAVIVNINIRRTIAKAWPAC